jgi:signal transduction histidine kinase
VIPDSAPLHDLSIADHGQATQTTPGKHPELARLTELLARVLRVSVVVVVTDQRVLARGLSISKPECVRECLNLAALVPVGGVMSVSDLAGLSHWTQMPITNGLHFLAGTGLESVRGDRLTVLVMDALVRPALTYTERVTLEEFSSVFKTLLELEPAMTDGQSSPVHDHRSENAHSRQAEAVRSDARLNPDVALEDAKRQAINDERLRIAREMHDGFGKELFGLALLLESVAETQKGRVVQHELLSYAQAARRLGNEGRALLQTFRESEPLEFVPALRAIIAPFLPDLNVHCDLPEDLPELDQTFTRELGRVLEEALENVRRHAQTCNAWVMVKTQDDHLVLRVDDDGRGMAAQQNPGRYGLIGMRERVAVLNGSLKIEPNSRMGTRIEARVPLKTFEENDVNRS